MKGEEKCEQDLESLQTLAEHFHSHPGLQARFFEDKTQQAVYLSAKGLVQNLIEKRSGFNRG